MNRTVAPTSSPIPPRLDSFKRTGSLFPLLVILPIAAVLGILYFFEPGRRGIYPVCFFYQTTGLLCPGCGSLRAMHQLLHLHIGAAFHLNPLLVCALPFVAAIFVVLTIAKFQNRKVTVRLRPWWIWIIIAVAFVFGVARNIPLPALAWLRP